MRIPGNLTLDGALIELGRGDKATVLKSQPTDKPIEVLLPKESSILSTLDGEESLLNKELVTPEISNPLITGDIDLLSSNSKILSLLASSKQEEDYSMELPSRQGKPNEMLVADAEGNLNWVPANASELPNNHILIGKEAIDSSKLGQILASSKGLEIKPETVLNKPYLADSSLEFFYKMHPEKLSENVLVKLPALKADDELIFSSHPASLEAKNIKKSIISDSSAELNILKIKNLELEGLSSGKLAIDTSDKELKLKLNNNINLLSSEDNISLTFHKSGTVSTLENEEILENKSIKEPKIDMLKEYVQNSGILIQGRTNGQPIPAGFTGEVSGAVKIISPDVLAPSNLYSYMNHSAGIWLIMASVSAVGAENRGISLSISTKSETLDDIFSSTSTISADGRPASVMVFRILNLANPCDIHIVAKGEAGSVAAIGYSQAVRIA